MTMAELRLLSGAGAKTRIFVGYRMLDDLQTSLRRRGRRRRRDAELDHRPLRRRGRSHPRAAESRRIRAVRLRLPPLPARWRQAELHASRLALCRFRRSDDARAGCARCGSLRVSRQPSRRLSLRATTVSVSRHLAARHKVGSWSELMAWRRAGTAFRRDSAVLLSAHCHYLVVDTHGIVWSCATPIRAII